MGVLVMADFKVRLLPGVVPNFVQVETTGPGGVVSRGTVAVMHLSSDQRDELARMFRNGLDETAARQEGQSDD